MMIMIRREMNMMWKPILSVMTGSETSSDLFNHLKRDFYSLPKQRKHQTLSLKETYSLPKTKKASILELERDLFLAKNKESIKP